MATPQSDGRCVGWPVIGAEIDRQSEPQPQAHAKRTGQLAAIRSRQGRSEGAERRMKAHKHRHIINGNLL